MPRNECFPRNNGTVPRQVVREAKVYIVSNVDYGVFLLLRRQPPLIYTYSVGAGYFIVIPIFKSTHWSHGQNLSFITALVEVEIQRPNPSSSYIGSSVSVSVLKGSLCLQLSPVTGKIPTFVMYFTNGICYGLGWSRKCMAFSTYA